MAIRQVTRRALRALRALDWRLGCGVLLLWRRILPLGGRRAVDERLPGLQEIQRVLVIRLDEIGDMVLTTPFVRELRRNLPRAHITLVVRPLVHDLVALCPYVDRVLAYDYAESRYQSALLAIFHAARFVRRQLGSGHFDLAIAPRWDTDSGLASILAFVSRARCRIGYSERVTPEKCYLNRGLDGLLTHVHAGGEVQHEVVRGLDLIRFLGGSVGDERLELWLGDPDERFADNFLASHGVRGGDFLLAVAPGAYNPRRRWPASRFLELARWSRQELGGFVVVIGGGEDTALGEQLRGTLGSRVVNAAGRASLRETAALLRRCTLFAGNDSGPLHLAAASGIPVLEISCHPRGGVPDHENSPLRFGPWCADHAVLQPAAPMAPCLDACRAHTAHCIRNIPVADAAAQVTGLLSSSRSGAKLRQPPWREPHDRRHHPLADFH